MTRSKLVAIVKLLRYILLATAVAGAIRFIFFMLDPNLGMGLMLVFVFVPILVVLFVVALIPWETTAKHIQIPLLSLAWLDLSISPFLGQSVKIFVNHTVRLLT